MGLNLNEMEIDKERLRESTKDQEEFLFVSFVLYPHLWLFVKKVDPILARKGPAEPQVPLGARGAAERPRLQFRACGAPLHLICGPFSKKLSKNDILREMLCQGMEPFWDGAQPDWKAFDKERLCESTKDQEELLCVSFVFHQHLWFVVKKVDPILARKTNLLINYEQHTTILIWTVP